MQAPTFSWPHRSTLVLATVFLQACLGSDLSSQKVRMQPSSTQQRCQEQTTVLSIPYDLQASDVGPIQGRLLGGMHTDADGKAGYIGLGRDEKVRQAVPSAAAQYGFRVKAIDKDGNCLFKATADQIQHQLKIAYTGSIPLYQVLRRIAANHIVSCVRLYKNFTPSQSLADVEKLIQALDKDREWAGDEALAALSRALQLTIVSVQDNGGKSGTISVRKAAYTTGGTIYLHYLHRSHYESLYKDGDTAAAEARIKAAEADRDFIPADIPNLQTLLHDTARAMAEELEASMPPQLDLDDLPSASQNTSLYTSSSPAPHSPPICLTVRYGFSSLSERNCPSPPLFSTVGAAATARAYGFKIGKQTQDTGGHHLFDAMADQLQKQAGITFPAEASWHAAALRRVAASHIAAHPALYKSFEHTASVAEVEQQLRAMEKAPACIHKEVLQALCRALQVSVVHIQEPDDYWPTVYKPACHHNPARDNLPLYLYSNAFDQYALLTNDRDHIPKLSVWKAFSTNQGTDTAFVPDIQQIGTIQSHIDHAVQCLEAERKQPGLEAERKQLVEGNGVPERVQSPASPSSSTIVTAIYAPPAIAFFVGRDAIRKELVEALSKASSNTITYQLISGPGGMGKSQLALQLFRAAQDAPEQYDHVLWLPAESCAQLTEAYLDLAASLGVYVDQKQPTRHAIAQVRRQLATQRCLYIFDAAPDLSVIQDFLPLQQGHVVITSRNGQQGAWPMETRILHLPGFDESAVVGLAAKFECALSAKDTATIAYLQREFSGHPAVLAQFFSFCQTQNLAPAAYIQELQHCPLDEREEELLEVLKTKPEGRVGYSKSALQMLRTSTEALGTEAAGKTALALMSRLAYLEPRSIPVDWLLTFEGTQRRLSAQRRVRTALALLERYSLVQWDRKTNEVHVQAVMQKLVRHLHPQASLQPLVQSLISYTSTEGDKKKRAAQWSAALLHGRRLYARLDPTRDLALRQALTAHLAKACKVSRLYAERCHWAQQHLAAVQQRYPEQNHTATAHALSELGVSLNQCGQYAEALKHKQAALSMRQAIAKSDDAAAQEQLARAHGEVGTTLSWLGRYQEALKSKQEALHIRQELYQGKDHAEVAHALNSLGELCVHLKDYRQAQQYTRQALEMRRRLYQDHANVARSLTGMGTVLERLGKYEEALKYRQAALDMDQRLSTKHSAVGLGHSLNHMGETLIRAGKPAAGIEYCTKALDLRTKHFKQPDHPHIAYSLNSIGAGLAAQGNYAAGLKHSQKALAMLQRIYAADHPYMVAVLENLIACLTKLGEAAKSVPYQQRLETLRKAQS